MAITDSITMENSLFGEKTFEATEQTFVVPQGNQDIDTTDEYDVADKATARVSEDEREKLIPENIKSGVTILGVEGSYAAPNKLPSVVDRSVVLLTDEDLVGVAAIGAASFWMCSRLESISIPTTALSIGNYAFYGCSSLTVIVVPSSVTYVGSDAFTNCSSLTSISFLATIPPTLQNVSAFTNTNDCPIYVPAESVDAYKAATNWSSLASRIQAIP